VTGTVRRFKWAALFLLLGLYYIAPWLRWDRGLGSPDQAILIDMTGRRAYLLGIEIWPQEVYYLTGLLILAAIGLFLATALFGRLWCGFACPQTVWSDLFMWVERHLEGDRNQRVKLDKQGWTIHKLGIKILKHAIWLVIAAMTGGAFILYFNDAPTVLPQIFKGEAGSGVYTFIAIFTGFTYLLAGWAREQVCIYMCPWPRFQASMVDEHSLIVSYESWRGEPRAHGKKGDDFSDRGHCIDCTMCVQVCPTGIDIREGSQLGCIGCGLCIDACNSVMDKVGLPRGLITWDSYINQQARAAGQPTKIKLVRPRTVAYALVLALVGFGMLYTLLTRSSTELNVLHERSPVYVHLSTGEIRNGYTIKVLNMVRRDQSYKLVLQGVPGAHFVVVGQEEAGDNVVLAVGRDRVGTYQMFVTAPEDSLKDKRMPITFVLTETDSGEVVRHENMFAGPDR